MKKRIYGIVLIAALLTASICLNACKDDDEPAKTYNIYVNQPASGGSFTVKVNNLTAVSGNTKAEAGAVITITAQPNEQYLIDSVEVTPEQESLSGENNV